MTTLYDFDALQIDGSAVPLAQYKGHAMLIVNTASACGFTPQFAGLEELHQQYGAKGLVVPMNALLQHRGHNLMGSGRSIAVQNFNEQACILGLGAFYSLSTGLGLSAFRAITVFGVLVAGFMWLIKRWHETNCRVHGAEVQHLLDIARNDHLHG